MLGSQYADFISGQTGEWESENVVLNQFNELFYETIAFLFKS
jgi:hypothetical protein